MSKQIRFDRSIYLPEAVEAAAVAYADYAQVKVSVSADAAEVEIDAGADTDLDEVANGFGNHVLYETIVRLRQGRQDAA